MSKVKKTFASRLSVKDIWDGIERKLPTSTFENIDLILPIIDDFITLIERQFKYNDSSVINLLKQEDFSPRYTDPSPIFKCLQLISELIGHKEMELITNENQIGEIRRLLSKLGSIIRQVDPDVIAADDMMKEILLSLRAGLIDLICHKKFGQSMYHLIKKGKEGDNSALFKVIQMDKCLLGSEQVNVRIREAGLRADQSFFRDLSNAVKKPPIKVKDKITQLKLPFFLAFLWFSGGSSLTVKEIFEILKRFDLYGPRYEIFDVETLRKFMNRLGLKKYKKIETIDLNESDIN